MMLKPEHAIFMLGDDFLNDLGKKSLDQIYQTKR